ncbi:MAG TPA: cell division protein FtsL [Nevskiaceae bacterium]|nr:cell division protein FtsL [Nevskiaceae bacterium]
MKRSQIMLLAIVGIGVLVSAVLVVKTKHENRRLVTELTDLRAERERLETEWSQLQLEEATLANHGRVEQIAREKLSMTAPKDAVITEAQP